MSSVSTCQRTVTWAGEIDERTKNESGPQSEDVRYLMTIYLRDWFIAGVDSKVHLPLWMHFLQF